MFRTIGKIAEAPGGTGALREVGSAAIARALGTKPPEAGRGLGRQMFGHAWRQMQGAWREFQAGGRAEEMDKLLFNARDLATWSGYGHCAEGQLQAQDLRAAAERVGVVL